MDEDERWVFVKGSVENVKDVLSDACWFWWLKDWYLEDGPVTG